VRSGILSSVHAFADSPLGPLFFGFLAVVLVGSIALALLRMPVIAAASPRGTLESLGSREAAILLNNLLLVGAAAATFWGTIVPLLSEALRGTRIAVGSPFYQQVNGPIFLVLLALLGVGPGLGWRRTPRRRVERSLRVPVAVALVASAVLLLIGIPPGAALAAWGLCAFVAATVLQDLARGVRRGRRRRLGAYLAHLAIALIAAGVVGSTWFQDDRTVTLAPGETTSIGRYAVRFDGLGVREIGGGEGIWAALRVAGPGGALTLRPERRAFVGWEDQAASGVAIATTWPRLDDVYVVLTGWETDGRASLHLFVNPLVCLIWAGGALLLGATALVAWPSGRPAESPSPRAAPLPTAVSPLVEA
jgi:cytochrome c-type biogenesis protein CcmF